MNKTSTRAQAIERGRAAASRLAHLRDLAPTVNTFTTIIEDAGLYGDGTAWTCVQELERLVRTRSPEPALSEHMIPVMFDVLAHTREEGAALLREALRLHDGAPLRAALDQAQTVRTARFESWWLPDVKHVDGNDRPAMHLVYDV